MIKPVNLLRNSSTVKEGQEIQIEFANNDKMAAKAEKRLKT